MDSALRDAHIQLAIGIEPTCIATYSEGPGLNPITVQQRLTHILNAVQRRAYGRNWYRRPAHQRIRAVGFREHHLTNPHWHLAIHAPGDLLAAMHEIKRTWATIQYKGEAWVDVLDDPRAYAEYITKNFYDPKTAENAFIYSA